MNKKVILFFIILIDLIFLFYSIDNVSISYSEAVEFYDRRGFIHYLSKIFTTIFGNSDIALRLPFILFHVGSVVLMYEISAFYLKKDIDRFMVTIIFIMLPGVTAAAILVNIATVCIFFTLLFIYFYLNKMENAYSILLPMLVFLDRSFVALYLALFIYGFMKKEYFISLLSFMLILVSLYIYGFDISNNPKVYFFNVFAIYAVIFSPLVFLYFFYAMYRTLLKGDRNIIWYISFVALIFSMVLSYRKNVLIGDFAPFVVIALPLMYAIFLHSYRIRLPELRGFHRLLFVTVFLSLVVFFLLTHLNRYLYIFLDNPKKHFAYKYHIAKELAQKLQKLGINDIEIDAKMQKRLKFYGINRGNKYLVVDKSSKHDIKIVTISYYDKVIKRYFVSKLHKK